MIDADLTPIMAPAAYHSLSKYPHENFSGSTSEKFCSCQYEIICLHCSSHWTGYSGTLLCFNFPLHHCML